MKHLFLLVALFWWLLPPVSRAQDQEWEIETLSPQNEFVYDLRSGSAVGTNGVVVKYGGAVLIADRVTVDQRTGATVADGNVRIQRDDQVWVGDHIDYNFKTRVMQTEQFRTGKAPIYCVGRNLSGTTTNQTYTANNAVITPDDFSTPAITIRARKIKIVAGKYIEARNALLYLEGVPVFYLPYYRRNLGDHANNFNFTPGYSSRFGPYLLGTYSWFCSEELDGALHLDYRLKRGVGAGPDINYHLGRWGDGSVRYYYINDESPNTDNDTGEDISRHRQRVYFNHFAEPYTNLTVRSQVRYQSDQNVNRDFFEGEYHSNPQPSTYVEINKFWDNFSLNAYAQPRVNDFFETVERLPDIRLTGFRQQLWNTPFYYQSESSLAFLRRQYGVSNDVTMGSDYSAARADSYHQLLAPFTALGWLNLTPRVGARYTFYSNDTGPGGTNSAASRGVFDTGIEASFKLSRTWAGATNHLLDVDGLRHIIEPSANYVYVPKPNERPSSLPQFDYMIPSLYLRPIDFPEMNSIDSIDNENTVRLGVRNTFQTRRDGELATLVNWELFTDWRLDPDADQDQFSNLYSDLFFAPRDWLTLKSELQVSLEDGVIPLSFHTLTIAPNDVWSWSLSHNYQRADPVWGVGNNVISSRLFYRLNENWGVSLAQYFEARTGRMESQHYSLYRDFRGWTSAITLRETKPETGSDNFTVAFTFSIKANPRYGLGADAVRPYSLTGD